MKASGELPLPRWLLPAELTEFDRPRRRTLRDWCVDLALFGFAIFMALYELAQPETDPELGEGLWQLLDLGAGLLSCLLLWWRRRIPLLLVWIMLPLQLAWTASGALFVAVMTAAVHRPWRPVVVAVAAHLAVTVPLVLLLDVASPFQLLTIAILGFYLLPMLWGMLVRGRRQLYLSLSREQSRLLEGARQSERRRIAREMHDTLAHRLSLLSVHAGALAYRTDTDPHNLSAPDVHAATEVIRDNARRAVTELGEVLTLLRSADAHEDDVLDGESTLPEHLDRLIAEAVAAGQRVELNHDGDASALAGLDPRHRRTVYRVVQEGLTNARKHAPDAAVTVRLAGDRREVTVELVNPLPAAGQRGGSGFGLGLTGLHERVTLDGGSLEHDETGGRFRLRARIPWSP